MKFRTIIPVPLYPFKISLKNHLFFMGSCFSEHFAHFFQERRFKANDNPFGILFNPLSIAFALDLMTGNRVLSEHFFQYFDGKWISFVHHGKFSHPDKEVFLSNIHHELSEAQESIQQTDYLFITLGTSYYYFHREKQMVVANCHKVPAAAFEKKCANIQQITEAFKPFFAWRNLSNPSLKIIFTVSPVRHLADGFHENQLSKSILHLAVKELMEQYKDVYYFPSYEIFNDDLRDYRFYDKDLCHPSPQGIEYVEEIVLQSFFDEPTVQQIKIIEKENKQLQHRPLLIVEEKK